MARIPRIMDIGAGADSTGRNKPITKTVRNFLNLIMVKVPFSLLGA